MSTVSAHFSYSPSLHTFIAVLICALGIATPTPTHTVSCGDLAKCACAGVLGYAISVGYMTTVVQDATNMYAPARRILALHANDQKQLHYQLKQEMLHAHDYMIRTSWFDTTYRHFPLVWYKNNLDSYISSLWMMSFFGIVDRQLLDDLAAIRDALVTDYDFIKERREYEHHYR